jgi:diphthamide synthase (EF-2-diphthine--ammonia ligase)
MLAAGHGAVLACVDTQQLDKKFLGRQYDADLLVELPAGVDPCGEWGEFQTFCYRSPEFSSDIPVILGEIGDRPVSLGEFVERDRFWFADLQTSITSCGVHPG